MHRNNHPSAPGGQHRDGDPQRGVAATVVTCDLMNALQDEIAHVVETFLGPLDKSDNSQLAQAIDRAIGSTVAGGDFVSRPELGSAAFRDVGASAAQVAVGNHGHAEFASFASKTQLSAHQAGNDPHAVYELKSRLGAAAYKTVGAGAEQVAAGNHSHPELANAARAYYADVYSRGATDSTQARALAAAALPIEAGDTLLVRWQEYYTWYTGNGTSEGYRAVQTYWLYQGGWFVILESR